MIQQDISHEEYREIIFPNFIYRIDHPVELVIGKTTHRVTDRDGVTHLYPNPSVRDVVVRWSGGVKF